MGFADLIERHPNPTEVNEKGQNALMALIQLITKPSSNIANSALGKIDLKTDSEQKSQEKEVQKEMTDFPIPILIHRGIDINAKDTDEKPQWITPVAITYHK